MFWGGRLLLDGLTGVRCGGGVVVVCFGLVNDVMSYELFCIILYCNCIIIGVPCLLPMQLMG